MTGFDRWCRERDRWIVPHRGEQLGAGLVQHPDILPEGRGVGGRIPFFPGQAGPPGGGAQVVEELLDIRRGVVIGGEFVARTRRPA